MTLKVWDGFDFVRDDSDLTARGWIRSGAAKTVNGTGVLGMPSKSTFPGSGLRLRGPYTSGAAIPFATTAQAEFGLLPTGQSIHSLWLAGGFAIGFNVTFNSTVQREIASITTGQIVYDGAQFYWAITQTGGTTFGVAFSTDLINWTPTAATPSSITQGSAITVLGSGSTATIIISRTPFNEANVTTFQYSTNQGLTWQTSGVAGGAIAQVISTGNATNPFLVPSWGGSGNNVVTAFTMTSITATPTLVSGLNLGSGNEDFSISRVVGSILFIGTWTPSTGLPSIPTAATSKWWGISNSSSLTSSASYISSASITNAQQNDITFFNNEWVSVGFGGIWTAPNSAVSPAIGPPTAAWTQVLTTSTIVYSVATNGTIAVAVGQDPTNTTTGAIWTSTNGSTWTKVNHFINAGTSSNASLGFVQVIWDGTRFAAFGAANMNVIATSTDGLNWQTIYYPDYTEAALGSSCLAFLSGTASAGIFTPWTASDLNIYGLGLSIGALSSGSRVLAGGLVVGGGQFLTSSSPQVTQSMASTTHYIELIAVAQSTTANVFSYFLAIDGVVNPTVINGGGSGNFLPLAASSDTGTQQLFVNLPRSGQVVQIDDFYLATSNGAQNVAPLGQLNIVPRTLSTNVQQQWTPSAGTSNVAAATASALSMAQTSISSATNGQKDEYGSTSTFTGNVRAVGVEGFFAEQGGTTPTVTVGIISGSSEVDSVAVAPTTATPVFAQIFSEVDPATSATWTLAAAKASKVAVTKVS